MRPLPLPHQHPLAPRSRPAGHHQDPVHALWCTPYGRAPHRRHPAWPGHDARHFAHRRSTQRPARLPALAMTTDDANTSETGPANQLPSSSPVATLPPALRRSLLPLPALVAISFYMVILAIVDVV